MVAFAALAPVIAAGVSAGGGLLGGALSSAGQASANAQQMAFNHFEAQFQREWQEHMASTGYARAMTDMRNAGLNPILAASLGPSIGGGGSAASATLGNPGAGIGEGVTTASRAGEVFTRTKAQLEQAEKDRTQQGLNEATTNLTKASENKAVQDTATSRAQERQADAQTENLQSVTRNNIIQSSILSHGVNTAKEEAEIRRLAREAAQNAGVGTMGQDFTTIERITRRALDAIRGNDKPAGSQEHTRVPSPSREGRNPILPPAPSPERERQGERFRGN